MKYTIFAVLIIFLGISFFSFEESTSTKINLRFVHNYPTETQEKQKTGLLWTLSFLGAELPKNSFDKALTRLDSGIFELDISKIGFNEKAVLAFEPILKSLKQSEEYIAKGGVDLGVFISYTIGSSWHYYEITGAAKTLKEYKKQYDYSNTVLFPVLKSDVADHHRLIEMVNSDNVLNMSFLAIEGPGNLDDSSFIHEVYEVFDIMPNGQLRFAVYDKNGGLVHSSAKKYGHAGKPVKCLWCHEINIQPLFSENTAVKGYMNPDDFCHSIAQKMDSLTKYRMSLNTDINFTNLQDHAFMEIQYISYMEPSIYRMKNEWGFSEVELSKLFEGLNKHNHREYSFLNNLFQRWQVHDKSPYKSVSLPFSIWEPNDAEPNVFK